MNRTCTKCKLREEIRPGRNVCKKCENKARRKKPERLDANEARVHNKIAAGVVYPYNPPAPRFEPADFDVETFEIESNVVREPEILVTEVEQLSAVEEHRLKVKNADLLRQVKTLTAQLSDAQFYSEFARESAEAAQAVEPIQIREYTSGLLEGTVQVLASDWHIEESVRPEQVADRNVYNLDISKQRMERFFQATRFGIDFSRQAYKIRDMILWLGGDLITNHLHPDNTETNLLSPVEAIAYAYQNIKAGIEYLLEDSELERIVIPCNDGNHGRLTEKMRSAARVQSSIEWLLYKMLADAFAKEPRVQFIIAAGSQIYYDVYDRTVRYTHGDECKYGGGVGGITIPIYKALARWETVRHAELTCMGHFHQRTNLNDLIINGSLIGYSPYSLSIGARFEPPAQDFSVLGSKRFRGLSMPLYVSSTEDDQG